MFTYSDHVFYKQVLDLDTVNEILSANLLFDANLSGGISTGYREYADLNIEDFELKSKLEIVLRDYFPDIEFENYCRYYNHVYGAVKPHTDSLGPAQYTLLIYLSDDFEEGELSVKIKRSELDTYPELKHKVFKFEPRKGYGIVFRKEFLHWAEEVTAEKKFLLVHIRSSF